MSVKCIPPYFAGHLEQTFQTFRVLVFVLCGGRKKVSRYIHLMVLFFQSSGIVIAIMLDGYLVGKEIVILLFEYVVGKCFVVFYVFSFPPAVYVGTLNLIASIPGPSILTFLYQENMSVKCLPP